MLPRAITEIFTKSKIIDRNLYIDCANLFHNRCQLELLTRHGKFVSVNPNFSISNEYLDLGVESLGHLP